MIVYLIGSLRNPDIPVIASQLRKTGHEVVDDWFAAGPEADDKWRNYEKARGRTYPQALREGLAADHVFRFDLFHVERADAGVLVSPCGKSGFLELGYMLGRGKKGYILLDSPDRWDVMFKFATNVYTSLDELVGALNGGSTNV